MGVTSGTVDQGIREIAMKAWYLIRGLAFPSRMLLLEHAELFSGESPNSV